MVILSVYALYGEQEDYSVCRLYRKVIIHVFSLVPYMGTFGLLLNVEW